MFRCRIKLNDRGEKVKYIYGAGHKEFKFKDEMYDIDADCVYHGSFIPLLWPSIRSIDYMQGRRDPLYFWKGAEDDRERPMKTIDDCIRSLNLFSNIKKLDYLLYAVVGLAVVVIISMVF